MTLSSEHQVIVDAYATYVAEYEAFTEKGTKVAGTRARKALGILQKSGKIQRANITGKKGGTAKKGGTGKKATSTKKK